MNLLQAKSEEYQSLKSKQIEEEDAHTTLYLKKDEEIADLAEKLKAKIKEHNAELKSLCSANKSQEEELKAKQRELDKTLSKKDDELKDL